MHKLEAAGFGIGPFRCIDMFQMPNKETATYQDYCSLPKVTRGGAGSCRICGTGLVYNYIIRDAVGDTFIVGCDCLEKINDVVLTKEMRAVRREKRDAAKIKERAEQRAIRQAQWEIERKEGREALIAQHGEMFDKARALGQEWLSSIVESVLHYGRMSERQQAAIMGAIERAEEIAARKNEFFGEIKKRVTITVTVQRWITLFHGDYYNPTKYLVIMLDSEGRTFKYVGTGSCIPAEGEEITMKCTITEHEEYQGVKQTTINRPARVETK